MKLNRDTYYLVNYDGRPIIVEYDKDGYFQFIGSEWLVKPKEFYKKGKVLFEVNIKQILLNAVDKKEEQIYSLETFGKNLRRNSFLYKRK